jgi:DNA-binding response OmpR family regulator
VAQEVYVHLTNSDNTCPTCGQATDRIEGITYDHDTRTLAGDGYRIEFTKKEGIIFSLLWKAHSSRRVITLERIIDALYSHNPSGGPLTERVVIRVLLHHIRRKLLKNGAEVAILTRWNTGYMLRFLDKPDEPALPPKPKPLAPLAEEEMEMA